MKEVKIYFTGGKDNMLVFLLSEIEILTLKEWIINDTPTLTIYLEYSKNEITLFRSHISCIQYG
jgi:hypothetical protein